MRFLLVASFVAFPALAAAQASPAATTPIQAEVRSVDPSRAVTMQVALQGRLFHALGPGRGADGRRLGEVHLSGGGGMATTPAALEVGPGAGTISFEAPADGPAIEVRLVGTNTFARGRVVRVVRDSVSGQLHVEASVRGTK